MDPSRRFDSSAAVLDRPASIGRAVLPPAAWHALGKCLKLCRRELQIVQSVFDDHKEQHIANDLGISPHTVNTYVQRLYHKLGVSSRSQLIVHVVSQFLRSQEGDGNGGSRAGAERADGRKRTFAKPRRGAAISAEGPGTGSPVADDPVVDPIPTV